MWKLQVERYGKEAPSYQKKIRILSNPSSKDVSKVDTEETLYKNYAMYGTEHEKGALCAWF